jgi:YVTN family beta-propeller protein
MYLTESGSDRLLELDTATGEVLRSVETGREPRTMAISPDGLALYVVNYYANTVSKFDTETLEEVQTVEVGQNPIGITYEPTQRRVWVANYAGSIDVFDDTAPRGGTMEP